METKNIPLVSLIIFILVVFLVVFWSFIYPLEGNGSQPIEFLSTCVEGYKFIVVYDSNGPIDVEQLLIWSHNRGFQPARCKGG